MTQKILFIEDEGALQKVVSEVLTQEGYKVISALDGEKGLADAKALHPDLILLDLILPKVDGFAVLKKLKEDQGTEDIPVIVLTNLETAKDIEKILTLGATTYLVKANYKLEDVVKKIKEVLA